MTRQKIANGFLMLTLFLLPWQTIFLYRMVSMPEGGTVYGNLGVYLTEICIVLSFLLRGRPMVSLAFQKILRALYLFLAACFFSLAWSHIFSVSIGIMSHLMVSAMLFLLLLDERTNIMHVAEAFLSGLILPCILGWFQYINGWSPSSTLLGLAEKHVETGGIAVVATETFRSLRAYGSFPHPNIFGGYLAVVIVVIGWIARKQPPLLSKERVGVRSHVAFCAIAFMIALFTSTLILSFSRGAWLALTVSLVAILAQAFWYKKLVPHRAIPLLSIGLITIVLSIGILHSHVFARFNPALHVEAISIEERASQYQTFPDVFKISPFVGVGPGTYVFALESLSKNQPSWSYQPIHNAFLLLLAELGIVGFVAFGYFVFEIIRVVSIRVPVGDGRDRPLRERPSAGRIFATAFLLELFILASFDHYLFSMWPGIVLVAIVFAISLRLTNES